MPALPPGPAWLSLAIALVAAACMAILVEHIHNIEQDRSLQADRNAAIQQAAALRARIEAELSASIFAATGLVGYVAAHEDFLDPVRVNAALAAIYQYGRHLRNVALAPDNVLSYVYPIAGNEAAVGLDYRSNPEQWSEVERAMEIQSSVLAGPLDLVQGGRGLINRTPVYLRDGRYWGLLSVVIDSDSLFALLGDEITEGRRFALRWQASSLRAGQPVAGEPSVFEQDHVSLAFPVPGGEWELAVTSRSSQDAGLNQLRWYRAGGHLFALLVASLLFIALRERRVIAQLALTDQLTGLPNRRAFQRQLARAIRHAQRQDVPFALVYVDLDGFKAINDRSGHAHGDRILRILSERMRRALDKQAMLARIGGDEFVFLLPDVGDVSTANDRSEPAVLAVRQSIEGLDADISLDATVGVAIYPADGQSAEALLSTADGRMYEAKARVSYTR